MQRLSVIAALCFLLSTSSAFGCCEDIIARQPENLQTQAREFQKLLESRDAEGLGILVAAGHEVCDLIGGCQNLSPEFVARLAARVEESRFRTQTDARLDWQIRVSMFSVLIAFAALVLSFLAFRKK